LLLPSLTKDMQTELLEFYMTDTEHSTTSDLNEVVVGKVEMVLIPVFFYHCRFFIITNISISSFLCFRSTDYKGILK